MILQVNKKKEEDKNFIENGSHEVFDDFIELLYSSDIKQRIIPSSKYERKSGKTTTLKLLAERHKLPYISISSKATDVANSISLAHQNSRKTVIVDEVDSDMIERLNRQCIYAVGIVQIENKDIKLPETKKHHKTHKIYEDYIEISSIQSKSEMVTAQARDGEINLYRDKKFEQKRDDNYNCCNENFYIDSVYLLDDTGKTIKKLM